MISKTMTALSFAAAFALAGAAQAQNTMPNEQPGAAPSTQQPGAANPPANTQANPPAGRQNAQRVSRADQTFMRDAIQGDLAEVKVGQLAQQKGQSDDVKQFGKTLEQDHSANLQKAQQLAQQLNIQAPNQPNAQQRRTYDRLSKLSGSRFDQQFAKDMVQDHKKDISNFQKHARGQGPVAQFAKDTVPTLQKHLQMAQSIENQGATVGRRMRGGSNRAH